jgi:Fic/DOC family protein
MSTLVRRPWPSGDYDAYVPDLLMEQRFELDAAVGAAVAEAERALTGLKDKVITLKETEARALLLLPADALTGPRVGSLVAGRRRLLLAADARAVGYEGIDPTAEEVLGSNIGELTRAVDMVVAAETVTTDGLVELHRRVLARTDVAEHAGRFRQIQNWLGGDDPRSADSVPPPPDRVEELVDDLCAFVNDETLPPVAHAAVVHAQLQTIHPFFDGNGRTCRLLTHVVLRRRGVAAHMLPALRPVLLDGWDSYLGELMAVRYRDEADSPAAHASVNRWIAYFATTCRRAVDDAVTWVAKIDRIQRAWEEL